MQQQPYIKISTENFCPFPKIKKSPYRSRKTLWIFTPKNNVLRKTVFIIVIKIISHKKSVVENPLHFILYHKYKLIIYYKCHISAVLLGPKTKNIKNCKSKLPFYKTASFLFYAFKLYSVIVSVTISDIQTFPSLIILASIP